MNRQTMKIVNDSHESGVALIYALALLGLLLVMLLGFLSSSILEQRIAYNQSSQVGANLLAKSALIRVKAQLGEYADASVWMLNRQMKDHDKLVAPLVSLADKEKSLAGNKDASETEAYQALEPLLNKYGMVGNFFPGVSLDFPEWINYYVSDGKSDARRVTGRVAYAVIPNLGIDSGLLQGNTYGPTAGKDLRELGCGFDFLTSSGVNTMVVRSNWLTLDLLTGNKALHAEPKKDGNTTYVNSKGRIRNEFFEPGELNGRALVNYYFANNQPSVKEVAWNEESDILEAQPSNRYNLGEGSALYVDHTLTSPLPLVNDLVNGPLLYTASGAQRYQIAANLVDYIDSDSKPTSDVDASMWLTETPTYAGLERTPYINQIVPATAGKCVYSVNIKVSKDGLTASVTQTLACTISGRTWVELANPYDAYLSGRVTLKDVTMNLGIIATKGAENTPMPVKSFKNIGSTAWNGAVRLSKAGENTLFQNLSTSARKYNTLGVNNCITMTDATVTFQDVTVVSTSPSVEANIPVIKLKMNIASMGFERALLQPYLSGAYQSYYADFVPGMSVSGELLPETLLSVEGKTIQTAAFADFEAKDPRCNGTLADWDRPTEPTVENEQDIKTIWNKIPNLGSKNIASKIKNVDFSKEQDLEPDDDPVMVSTGYIRNAPMRSLWELGFVHRGALYQTLNLKSAADPTESNYDSKRYGYRNDAQLLDRFTLDQNPEKLKKYNINQPSQNLAAYGPLAGGHWKSGGWVGALYYTPLRRLNFANGTNNSPVYQTSNSTLSAAQFQSLTEWMANKWYDNKSKSYTRYIHRGMLANVIADWAENGDSPYINNDSHRDAQVEELIGKLVPLTRCGDIYENFTLFAVAESIKDVGSTSGNKMIVKYDRDGKAHEHKCKYGEIDYDGDFMFDEVTGRSYLVARLRREIVGCKNTKNCRNGIHEPDCRFKVKVLESYVLNDL